MRNYYLDGVMGVAVGDALGLPVQFMDRREIANDPVKEMRRCDLFWSPAGTWSDDTAMTVAMLDSIRKLGHIDAEDIMKNFIKWLNDAEYTACDRTIDVGNTCFEGIKRYEKEHDIKTCGKTGEHANGNGSLMRTIPICIFYAEKVHTGKAKVEEAIEQIHTVSALTHKHIRACMACGLYFFCTMSIMYGEGTLIERLQKGMDEGFKFYGADEENNFELTHYGQFMELTEFRDFPEDMIKSTGYVVVLLGLSCLVA